MIFHKLSYYLTWWKFILPFLEFTYLHSTQIFPFTSCPRDKFPPCSKICGTHHSWHHHCHTHYLQKKIVFSHTFFCKKIFIMLIFSILESCRFRQSDSGFWILLTSYSVLLLSTTFCNVISPDTSLIQWVEKVRKQIDCLH